MLTPSCWLIDQPFEVGDRSKSRVTGTVMSVGILSTKILTLTEQLVVMPNNNLVNSTITQLRKGGGDGQGSITLT